MKKQDKKITAKTKEKLKINSKVQSPKSPLTKTNQSPQQGTRKRSLTIEIPTVETIPSQRCVEAPIFEQSTVYPHFCDKILCNHKCRFCHTPYLIFALRIYEQVLIEDATTYEHRCFIVRRRIQLDGPTLDEKLLRHHIQSVCETLKLSLDDVSGKKDACNCTYSAKMPLMNLDNNILNVFKTMNAKTITEPEFSVDNDTTDLLDKLIDKSYDFLVNIGDDKKEPILGAGFSDMSENGRNVALFSKTSADNIECQITTLVQNESISTTTDDFCDVPQKDEGSIREESIGDFIDYNNINNKFKSKHEIVDMLLNKNQRKISETDANIQMILTNLNISEKDIPVKENSTIVIQVDTSREIRQSIELPAVPPIDTVTRPDLFRGNLMTLDKYPIISNVEIVKHDDFGLEIKPKLEPNFVSVEDVKQARLPQDAHPVSDELVFGTHLVELGQDFYTRDMPHVQSTENFVAMKPPVKKKVSSVEMTDAQPLKEILNKDSDVTKKRVSIQDDDDNINSSLESSGMSRELKNHDLSGSIPQSVVSDTSETDVQDKRELDQCRKIGRRMSMQKDELNEDINKRNSDASKRSNESPKSLEHGHSSDLSKKRVSIATYLKSNEESPQDQSNPDTIASPTHLVVSSSMTERIEKNRFDLAKFRYYHKELPHTRLLVSMNTEAPIIDHARLTLIEKDRERDDDSKDGCCSWAKKIKRRTQKKNSIKKNDEYE